jgi:hypothetical protein
MKTNQISYYSKIKANIIALIPIVVLSVFFALFNQTKDSMNIIIFLILILYNVLVLPLYLTYINLFKYWRISKLLIDYFLIITIPILGEIIQYMIMYVINTKNLYPSVSSQRDDITIAFFLYPAVISVIFSSISFGYGQLTKYINRQKETG